MKSRIFPNVDPLYLKFLSIPLIFTAGYYTGMLPLRMRTDASGQKLFARGNAFSLGIFLGAALLHLLPDAQDHWILWLGPAGFPWAALITGLGLLAILLLEEGILGGSEDLGSIAKDKKSVYPYLLCIILSVHSLIAGISMGLEGSFLSASVLCFALLAHKGSAAFALGISLRLADFDKSSYRGIIALFSSMVPAGILLGLLFASLFSGKTDAAIEAIFDALAAGTFLYIALIDILPEVFEKKSEQGIKLLLVMTGFSVMTALAITA